MFLDKQFSLWRLCYFSILIISWKRFCCVCLFCSYTMQLSSLLFFCVCKCANVYFIFEDMFVLAGNEHWCHLVVDMDASHICCAISQSLDLRSQHQSKCRLFQSFSLYGLSFKLFFHWLSSLCVYMYIYTVLSNVNWDLQEVIQNTDSVG